MPISLTATGVPVHTFRKDQAAAIRTRTTLYDRSVTFRQLYRSQRNVATAVNALASNMAALPWQGFRRVDGGRGRLPSDHPLELLLSAPSPEWTAFRCKTHLIAELCIHGNAFARIIPASKLRSRNAPALVPVFAHQVKPEGGSMLGAEAYKVRWPNGDDERIPAAEMLHLRHWDPDDPRVGMSPLEPLREILAEDFAAAQSRPDIWRNGLRASAAITRPLEAPEWDEPDRERFRAQMQAFHGGENAGKFPVFEDGMAPVEFPSVTARDMEYIKSRQLNRQEVAAVFQLPPQVVGILDGGFSSEQRRAFYVDAMGPLRRMLREEISAQLLPWIDGGEELFVELNIESKLQGALEEQADAFARTVGVPIMSINEARALRNLSPVDEDWADTPVQPLNILYGGQLAGAQSMPGDVAPKKSAEVEVEKDAASSSETLDDRAAKRFERLLAAHARRALRSIEARMPADEATATVEVLWSRARWDDELAADLLTAEVAIGALYGADLTGGDAPTAEVLTPFLEANSRAHALSFNDEIDAALKDAIADRGDEKLRPAVAARFAHLRTVRAAVAANEVRGDVRAFGREMGAKKTGRTGHKIWRTRSRNPRSAHAAINGEQVALGEKFSNGADFPRDRSHLSADQSAGCQCEAEYVFDPKEPEGEENE